MASKVEVSDDSKPKLIAIVGPTASGKTELALKIAQQFNGEIICADSRTVYREMNIGTAKPDTKLQKLVKHHCINMVNHDDEYNAKLFQSDARKSVEDILSRGKIPILVGGTGLYVNAFLYNYEFPKKGNKDYRQELEMLSLKKLGEILKKVDPESFENVDLANPRRIIRAIETANQKPKMTEKLPPTHMVIGLNLPKSELSKNIAQRSKKMIKDGLVNEAVSIAEKYGNNIEPLNTVGYKQALLFSRGGLTLKEAEEQINTKTWQLARRQMTWFKRDKNIDWFNSANSALAFIESIYSK